MSLLKKKVIENECVGLDQENESGKVNKNTTDFWLVSQAVLVLCLTKFSCRSYTAWFDKFGGNLKLY